MRIPILRVTFRLQWGRLIRDSHSFPHPMTDGGGCACSCMRCVTSGETAMRRCKCPRCNENCMVIGRLGSLDSIRQDIEAGAMPGGKPGSKWYIE